MLQIFVQVAFDLIDADRQHYDDMEVSLGQRSLSRSVFIPGRGRLTLPRNTFAGIHNCFNSVAEAIKCIRESLEADGLYGDVSGHAFITASILDQTDFSEVHFGVLATSESK